MAENQACQDSGEDHRAKCEDSKKQHEDVRFDSLTITGYISWPWCSSVSGVTGGNVSAAET
jgi:hypothetical protein